MSTPANGIARIMADIGSQVWSFVINVGQDDVTGTWSRSNNKSVWQGGNPVIKNETGSTETITFVDVHYGEWTSAPAQYELVSKIFHTGVTLNDQESIEYTSVEIDHLTDSE